MASWTIALAGALCATHSIFVKLLLSLTLRVYQYLEWDEKRKESVETNKRVIEAQKAQLNEAEFAPLIVVMAFYLAMNENSLTTNTQQQVALAGASLAAVGNILYVYYRPTLGYPNPGIIAIAAGRYLGMVLMASQIWIVVTALAKNVEA